MAEKETAERKKPQVKPKQKTKVKREANRLATPLTRRIPRWTHLTAAFTSSSAPTGRLAVEAERQGGGHARTRGRPAARGKGWAVRVLLEG